MNYERHRQDLALSHSFINFLGSSFQGHFVAHKMLSELKSQFAISEEQALAERALNKIEAWKSELHNNIALISLSWSSPETFDARRAFDLLRQIKGHLSEAVRELHRIHSLPAATWSADDMKYLVASFGRFSYTADFYVAGYIEYATVFQLNDIVEDYKNLSRGTSADINMAHHLFDTMQGTPAPTKEFLELLYEQTLALHGTFRSYIHDIHQMLNIFQGEFSYQLAEIPPPEAMRWQQNGFPPLIAGYWRAHDISPEESSVWLQSGFRDPGAAIAWRTFGFSAVEAAAWAVTTLPPIVALRWRTAGFTPEQTIGQIKRGFKEPPNPPPSKEG